MKIFCQDQKLNISPAYLLPGFAFGGSCLPKDLRALAYQAKMHDLQLPIITSILPSNEMQVARGLQLIMEKGHKRVGILGFSFKAGTDDLRESPMIEVIERLIGKGYDLRIYDKNVNIASLVGANRDFILNRIPHISRLMVDGIDAVLDHAQTIVIGNKDPEFRDVPQRLRDGSGPGGFRADQRDRRSEMASTTASAGKHVAGLATAAGMPREQIYRVASPAFRLAGEERLSGLRHLRRLERPTSCARSRSKQSFCARCSSRECAGFPINLRPLLGIAKSHSTKGMGFLARGFMRLHEATGDAAWRDKAEFALQWLIENQSKGYPGPAGAIISIISREAFICPRASDRRLDLADRPCVSGCL